MLLVVKSCSEFGNVVISWIFEIDFQKCEKWISLAWN